MSVEEILVLSAIVTAMLTITAIVFYSKGRDEATKSHLNAMRAVYHDLVEANKAAGVTDEQQLKINEVMATKLLQEAKHLFGL